MNCRRHPTKETVSQCENCGSGVCEDCAELTEPARNAHGTLCADCYSKLLINVREREIKEKSRRLKRVIISSVLYVIGLILIILSLSAGFSALTEDDIILLVAGILLCGIYIGLTGKKRAEEAHAEKERKKGVTYVIDDQGIHRDTGIVQKVIYFILGTLLGIIATPIMIILDIKGMGNNKKTIEEFSKMIQEVHNF